MHRTLVSFGPRFLKVTVLGWFAVLNGCAQLTTETVVVNRVVSGDGERFFGPMLAFSESANGIEVKRVRQPETGELRVSLRAPVRHVYLVSASECDTSWASVEPAPDGSVPRDAVMVRRPLAVVLQGLADDQLEQALDGVLAMEDQDAALEAVLAEISRRGGVRWLSNLHRVLREGRKQLAAATAIRRLEGKPIPLQIDVEVAIHGGYQWVWLRLTNADELQTYCIPEWSFVMPRVKMRDASGAVVFDRERLDRGWDWGLADFVIGRRELAPHESMLVQVDAVPWRLPPGRYTADWSWHDDIAMFDWHRFDADLVAFTGSCAVRVD